MIFLLSIVDFLGACVAKPWSETKTVNLVPRSHSVLPLSLGRRRSGYQIRLDWVPVLVRCPSEES